MSVLRRMKILPNQIYDILKVDSNRDMFERSTQNRSGTAGKFGPNYLSSGFQIKVAMRKLKFLNKDIYICRSKSLTIKIDI